MARPKAMVPALRFHISGQSVCEIQGTAYYLGPHGSPESLARYAVLIREYQANGLVVPPGITSQTLQELTQGFTLPMEKVSQADAPILIKHLVSAYEVHAKAVKETRPRCAVAD